MKTKPRLSEDHFDAIRLHCEFLIRSLARAETGLKASKGADKLPYVDGQIAYYRHAIKALTWAVKVAAQKAKVSYHADSA